MLYRIHVHCMCRSEGHVSKCDFTFDTTSLHNFIKDTFPGAELLEEHQVRACVQTCVCTQLYSTIGCLVYNADAVSRVCLSVFVSAKACLNRNIFIHGAKYVHQFFFSWCYILLHTAMKLIHTVTNSGQMVFTWQQTFAMCVSNTCALYMYMYLASDWYCVYNYTTYMCTCRLTYTSKLKIL